jgi:transcription termination/antitermination protein NusA
MDATAFFAAVNELAESKGISKEAVIDSLKDSIQKAYIKYLGGGDDAKVTVTIDEEKGVIEVAQIKTVVDDVQDDYLEISVEDANAGLKKAKYKAGDDFAIPCSVDDFSKVAAMAVKNLLRQNLATAERTALYEIYKDHIGEMVTGTVEKADDRSVSVNIGRTTVELGRREMIGDEYFKVGDPIKVYIQEVKSAVPEEGKAPRGPQIEVTRSSEGFLKRLFEEEIHEIYDGTVIIKGIAREAGIRSKVAVMSNNEDVDATGACIGQAGSRIQKIVAQLGNGKDKEKIDVINYSTNPGLFICEALRPATVVGVNLIDPNAVPFPKAIAVVKDEQLSLAIGRRGANARLANKITGWSIDIKEEKDAKTSGLEYTTAEEWAKKAEEEKKVKEREDFARKGAEEAAAKTVVAPVAPSVTPIAPTASANPSEFPPEAMNPATAALAEAKKQEEAAKAAAAAPVAAPAQEAAPAVSAAPVAPAPVQKPAPAPVTPTVVHTTTTLSDLEKELEAAKEKKTQPASKFRRPRKITEEEVKHATPVAKPGEAMPVYTEEELAALAKEEAENPDNANTDEADNAEEDVDYSDYDKYYDDDDKK